MDGFDTPSATQPKGCPAAADDNLFYQATLSAMAGWMAAVVSFLPKGIEQDWNKGRLTYRQSVLFCLDVFAEMSEDFGYFEAFGETARSISEWLKAGWDYQENPIPYCPAFR